MSYNVFRPQGLKEASLSEFERRYEQEVFNQFAAVPDGEFPVQFADCLFDHFSDHRNFCAASMHVQARLCPSAPEADLALWEKRDTARILVRELKSNTYRTSKRETVTIPKGYGKPGYRKIEVSPPRDRIVARALTQIIRPILERNVEKHAFARRGGGAFRAFAELERLQPQQNYPVWIVQDFKNAFDRVPSAVFNLLRQNIRNDQLCQLIEELAKRSGNRGIIQGCSLSPQLLELWLNRSLHKLWDDASAPLLRYVDDVIVLCRDQSHAKQVHDRLDELSKSAGMTLKYPRDEAIVDLRREHVQWLGYELRLGSRLEFRVPWRPAADATGPMMPNPHLTDCFVRLRERYADAWTRVEQVVNGLIASISLAFPYSHVPAIYGQVQNAADQAGLEIRPCNDFHAAWQRQFESWRINYEVPA